MITMQNTQIRWHKISSPRTILQSSYQNGLINSLTAPTAEGNLFEVDMRLRPSGTAGPIASHIDAFTKYHDESSWAWEHMALAKARAISGNAEFINQVNQIIEKTLTRPGSRSNFGQTLQGCGSALTRNTRTDSILEIKYFRGGIVDIEFIVQYLQLRTQLTIRPSYALILRALSRTSRRTNYWITAMQNCSNELSRFSKVFKVICDLPWKDNWMAAAYSCFPSLSKKPCGSR